MKRMHAEFTIRTEKPVLESRIKTMAEYLAVVAKRVGLYVHTTILKEEEDG